jgi:D-alanyl-D-alanine carboxypeptidase (penicillin-binding protein 5/6)
MAAALLVSCTVGLGSFVRARADSRSIAAVALWDAGGTYFNLRSAPNTRASVLGQIQLGARLIVLSSVQGEQEDGNPWWYRVRVGKTTGFVSSNAVDVLQDVAMPWVAVATDDGDPTTTSVIAYRGPQTSASPAASFALGARFTVTGQSQGEAVFAGNSTWYQLTEGALPPVYVYSAYLKFVQWGVAQPPQPSLSAAAAIAIDARTGRILYHLQDTLHRLPASTAKIMTALVALSRRSPAARMSVPAGVDTVTTAVDGSAMGLAPGETFTLHDLLYGMLLPSGNDAAYTIAQDVAGSQSAFVAAMNGMARQLGLRQTHFTNPTGLDDAGEYTTALDLAHLAQQALARQPLFARIVRTETYTIPATAQHPAFSLQNLNQLLGAYPGAEGVKTGTTPQAGENLVGAATRFGHQAIVVVLGSSDRFADATALLDYAFATLPSSARHAAAKTPAVTRSPTARATARR